MTEVRSALWRNHDFVRLFAAQVVSLLGSGATTIGLALFAHRMAGASSAVAVVGNALTLRIVAFLVFSQPAGVFADRVDRKTILVFADLVRALLLGFLPFATAVWHVYVLVFALNAATAFFTPTYEASVPAVVGEEHVVEALSISRVASDVEAVLAPAAAGIVVATVGARWVFWFDAATYLVSALLVVGAMVPRAKDQATTLSLGGFFGEVGYGTRAILREPSLRLAIVLSFVEALAGAVAIVTTVTFVRDVLGRGDASATILMALVGLGSSLTAILLGRLTGRYELGARGRATLHGVRHRWARIALLSGGFGLGVALLPVVIVPPFAVVALLWALNGAGQALIAIPSSTLLAEHTFDHDRGRVYAAHFALTHACWLVTYPVVGNAAAHFGVPSTATGAGAACLFITLAVALGSRAAAADHVHDHVSE